MSSNVENGTIVTDASRIDADNLSIDAAVESYRDKREAYGDELEQDEEDEASEHEASNDEDAEVSDDNADDGEEDYGDDDGEEFDDEADRVTHKIKNGNGEYEDVSLGQLKKEYANRHGREAAIKTKENEVSAQRQNLDKTLEESLFRSNKMRDRVRSSLAEYDNVDWNDLMYREGKDVYDAHKANFQRLAKEAHFFDEETSAAYQQLSNHRTEWLQAEAVKALPELRADIPDFDNRYQGLLIFAKDFGIPQDLIATMVNPKVIKLLNMAFLYHKGQKAKKASKPVPKTPTKVPSSTRNTEQSRKASKRHDVKALERKVASGNTSIDDMVQLYMANNR